VSGYRQADKQIYAPDKFAAYFVKTHNKRKKKE
jgi:hypothetical protein